MIIALSKCANFWSAVNLVSSKLWVCLHAGRSNMALVLICECGFLFCMKADIRDALGVVIIAWVLTISCWSPLKNKPTVKRQTHSLGNERQVCKPLMMMEYNLLHKGYNEGVTQQSIGNAFDMKALRYLGMNNIFFWLMHTAWGYFWSWSDWGLKNQSGYGWHHPWPGILDWKPKGKTEGKEASWIPEFISLYFVNVNSTWWAASSSFLHS